MLFFNDFNYNENNSYNRGRRQGLHYFKQLFAFSPQRCDCYTIGELLRYYAGQINGEKGERIFYHLEEFNCLFCNRKVKGITDRHTALERLAEFYGKRRESRKEHERYEKAAESKPMSKKEARMLEEEMRGARKAMDFLRDMREIYGDLKCEMPLFEPSLEVGQVWLSRLSKKKGSGKISLVSFPAMWSLLISEINSTEQTIKVLPLSLDVRMCENNFTFRLTGDEYWNCGLVEFFNEITTSRDQLVRYKGKLTSEQREKVQEMHSRVEWDFPTVDSFTDWAEREQELSAYLTV